MNRTSSAALPELKRIIVAFGNRLVMEYQSVRPFAALAKGLIEGSALYYGETLQVEEEDLSSGRGNHMRFTISQQLSR